MRGIWRNITSFGVFRGEKAETFEVWWGREGEVLVWLRHNRKLYGAGFLKEERGNLSRDYLSFSNSIKGRISMISLDRLSSGIVRKLRQAVLTFCGCKTCVGSRRLWCGEDPAVMELWIDNNRKNIWDTKKKTPPPEAEEKEGKKFS